MKNSTSVLFRLGFLPVLFLVLPLSPQALASGDGLKLLSFRASQTSLLQTGGGFYTGSFEWSPRYAFSGEFGARLRLGGTYAKSLTGSIAPVANVMGFGSYHMGLKWGIEAGAGIHSFINNGGTRMAYGANLTYALSFLFFDHFFCGYTYVNVPTRSISEIRLGLGTAL